MENPKEGNGSRWWLHNNGFTDRNIAQLDRFAESNDIRVSPILKKMIFIPLSGCPPLQAKDMLIFYYMLFYNEQSNEDRMGEFVSLLVNSSDLVDDSDTSEEFESDIELSTSLSSDSEQEVEESDIVDDLENDDE